jgi:hypothetical protein
MSKFTKKSSGVQIGVRVLNQSGTDVRSLYSTGVWGLTGHSNVGRGVVSLLTNGSFAFNRDQSFSSFYRPTNRIFSSIEEVRECIRKRFYTKMPSDVMWLKSLDVMFLKYPGYEHIHIQVCANLVGKPDFKTNRMLRKAEEVLTVLEVHESDGHESA